MPIERVIYGSLRCGIESESSGYQRYSYSSGYKDIISQSDDVASLLEKSYISPVMFKPYEAFGPSEDPNVVSESVENTFPKSFSYLPKEINGKNRALFIFGKNMGYDWTGSRPNAIFSSGLICDTDDVVKLPVLYCSSPLACCDIPRSSFFKEGDALVPRMLRNVKNLDDSDNCVDIPYRAGFDPIDDSEVCDFISEEDNADVLISMLAALLDYKSGKSNKRIVIADSTRNVLLWIAAITDALPEFGAKTISFTNYAYDLVSVKYDITGVFVPELNGLEREDSVLTKYDRHDPDAECEVVIFDMLSKNYPSYEEESSLLMEMVRCAYTIKKSLLTDYKEFLEANTRYTSVDWDLGSGYALYSLTERNAELSAEQLMKALEFADRYAVDKYKDKLFEYLMTNYTRMASTEGVDELITAYLKSIADSNSSLRNKMYSQAINDWFESFNNEQEQTNTQFLESGKFIQNMFGYSDYQLNELFWEQNKQSIIRLSGRQDWKNAYILKTIIVLIGQRKTRVEDSETRSLLSRVVGGLYGSYSGDSFINAVALVNKAINRPDDIISILDVFFTALSENPKCSETVLSAITTNYYNASGSQREAIDERIGSMPNKNTYYTHILKNASKIGSLSSRISIYNHIMGKTEITKEDANSMLTAINSVIKAPMGIDGFNITGCGEIYDFLNRLSKRYDLQLEKESVMRIADKCYEIMISKSDMEFSTTELETARVVFDCADKERKEGYHQILYAINVVDYIRAQVRKKVPISAVPQELILPDYSMLICDIRRTYNSNVGGLLSCSWVDTNILPRFDKFIYASVQEDYSSQVIELLTVILDSVAGSEKTNSLRYVADLIEMSIVPGQNRYMSQFEINADSILKEKVKKTDLIKILKKDLEYIQSKKNSEKKSLKAPNDFIDSIDAATMINKIERIETLYGDNKVGDKLASGIKNFFKRGNQ